jgi:GNAT superfamily N-acetyltransferase
MDLLGNRLLGEKGLLTDKHPFHKHAEVVYFLAERDGKVVGRIAGCINQRYNEQQNARAVIFGFWEVINEFEVARALLDRVAAWGKARGMTTLLGPMSFSTNEIVGIQLNAFDTLPYYETASNYPYYADLLDRYGMYKAMDVIAQKLDFTNGAADPRLMERINKIAERMARRNGLWTRPLDFSNLAEERKLIRSIYNDAWKDNWGATAFTEEEFNLTADKLRTIVKSGIALLGYVHDEAAAFFLILPDIYDCIKTNGSAFGRLDFVRVARLFRNKHRTRRGRVTLLGIKEPYRRSGLDAVLYRDALRHVRQTEQFDFVEVSWLLETNALIISAGESFAARHYKTWRIYEAPL